MRLPASGSNVATFMPARAKVAAMPGPMVPSPMTAAPLTGQPFDFLYASRATTRSRQARTPGIAGSETGNASARSIIGPRQMSATENFLVEAVEAMSFPDAFADVVLSSAVLHFARDDNQFEAMLRGTWRILKPGGLFFCRLASSIGIESRLTQIAGRRFLLPDGSQRYLVDEAMLLRLTHEVGGHVEDPLKTTVVQNQRSMTTWVVRKD